MTLHHLIKDLTFRGLKESIAGWGKTPHKSITSPVFLRIGQAPPSKSEFFPHSIRFLLLIAPLVIFFIIMFIVVSRGNSLRCSYEKQTFDDCDDDDDEEE